MNYFLLLFALPLTALADAPNYTIPAGISAYPQTCVTTELVQRPGKAAAAESTVTQNQVAYWTDGDAFISLEQAPAAVTFASLTETLEEGQTYHRVKTVTDWKQTNGTWTKSIYAVDITDVIANDGTAVVTEQTGNATQTWDVRTYGGGDDVEVSERLARDPNAFSSDGRQVQSHLETCRVTIAE